MALLDYEVPQRPKRRPRDAAPIAIAANACVVLFVAASYWLPPLAQGYEDSWFATALTAYIGGVSLGVAAALVAVWPTLSDAARRALLLLTVVVDALIVTFAVGVAHRSGYL